MIGKELLKSGWTAILMLITVVAAAALVTDITSPGPAVASEGFDREDCLEECRQDFPDRDRTARRFYASCVQQCEKTYWCLEKCREDYKPGTPEYRKCAGKCDQPY